MSRITYKVVKHEGGWAYQANGTYSKRFRTREAARTAARLAASGPVPGEIASLSDGKEPWDDNSG